jgi:hypothetical protein
MTFVCGSNQWIVKPASFHLQHLGGSQNFATADVYALLGLSLNDGHGETKSELQLVVRDAGGLTPHLICTSLSSFANRTYGDMMREFGALTGIRTVVAEPGGLFRGGDPVITEITAASGCPTQ